MVKALIGGEASVSAILGSFGAEAATGQLELVAAEAVILGLILSGKAIAKKIKENKSERQRQEILEEQNRQQIADNEEEERVMNQNRNYQRGNQMVENQDDFQYQSSRINNERQQRISQMESQMGLDPDNDRMHLPTPDPDFYMMSDEARDEIRREEEEKKRPQDPDGPDNEPNNDPNGGGNGGGGNPYNGGGNNDPEPDPNNGNSIFRNKNPYENMINWLQSMVNQQQQREKDRQKTEQDEKLTEEQKISTELQKETLDNQHIIQEQINAQLLALGQGELSQEETLVELKSISKLIDDQIPDQVKLDPTSVFSSELISF